MSKIQNIQHITFEDKEYLNNPAVSASPIPKDNEWTLKILLCDQYKEDR
jgi:hypothetical protein